MVLAYIREEFGGGCRFYESVDAVSVEYDTVNAALADNPGEWRVPTDEEEAEYGPYVVYASAPRPKPDSREAVGSYRNAVPDEVIRR